MSLSTQTVLPASSLRHLGVMVFLMSILMGAAGFGFISVSKLVNLWLSDTKDIISVEIPAYNDVTQSIYSDEEIQQTFGDIEKILESDPLIAKTDFYKAEDKNDTDLPTPLFLTLYLNNNHAMGAQNRVLDILHEKYPHVIVKETEEWMKDINQMALILRTAFLSLASAILVTTILMIVGIVRTQIKANAETISLVHLLGASSAKIRGVFQRAVTRPIFIGALTGSAALSLILTPIMTYVDTSNSTFEYGGMLGGVVVVFVFLSYIVTGLTVATTLREMP